MIYVQIYIYICVYCMIFRANLQQETPSSSLFQDFLITSDAPNVLSHSQAGLHHFPAFSSQKIALHSTINPNKASPAGKTSYFSF